MNIGLVPSYYLYFFYIFYFFLCIVCNKRVLKVSILLKCFSFTMILRMSFFHLKGQKNPFK